MNHKEENKFGLICIWHPVNRR